MNTYIKEWPNKTATLMVDGGTILWTFSSINEAVQAAELAGYDDDIQSNPIRGSQDLTCSNCFIG